MASSPTIRLTQCQNFQKEAILRPIRCHSFTSVNFRVVNVRNSGHSYYCTRKKQNRLQVTSSLNPESDTQPDVVVVSPILKENKGSPIGKDSADMDISYVPKLDTESAGGGGGGGDSVDGNGGNGKFGGGGGDGGGGDNEGDNIEEDEFGPLLKFEDVIRETEAVGVTLPSDILEAAKSVGIQKLILQRYLDLQGSAWPLGFLMKTCSMLRNRMLADPSFLFKFGTEIVIDSCCATFAEVQKRGKDFWAEFELYAADLLVGVVVNVALVGMLAPYVRIRQISSSQNFLGRIQCSYGALPSSVFEAERPGCSFSARQRIATYFFKGILYGIVGFGCGIVGQGIANFIMSAKRSIKKSEEHEVPIPPLLQSAALWGVFLAVSSNTRYQVINGLERVVEASPLTKQIPTVAMAFTVGVRFANNIYGGMQFVDWARLTGVQ